MAPSSVLSSVVPSPMLLSRTVMRYWVSVEPWTRGKNWFQTRPWTRTRWMVTLGAMTLIDPVTSMSWMTALGVSISRSPWWTDFGVQPAGVPVLPGVGNCWPTAGGRPVGPVAATDVKFCPFALPAVPAGPVPPGPVVAGAFLLLSILAVGGVDAVVLGEGATGRESLMATSLLRWWAT